MSSGRMILNLGWLGCCMFWWMVSGRHCLPNLFECIDSNRVMRS